MVAYPYSGADISYAQGNPAASAFPGQFVVINASRGNVGLVVGSEYHNQVNTMRAAGKWIGHYFFNGDSNSGPSPLASANFFVANLYNHALSDVLILDVESTGVVAWTPAQALVFAKQVFALTGKKIGIYLDQSLLKQDWSALVAFGCWLWLADYSGGLYPSGNWPVATMVQTSSAGFDHDLSSKTFAEINGTVTPVLVEDDDDMKLIRDTSTGSIAVLGIGYYYPFGASTGTDLSSENAVSKIWGPYTDLSHDEFLVNVAAAIGTYNFDLGKPYTVPWPTSATTVSIDPAALQAAITTAVATALAKASITIDPKPITDAVVLGITPLIPRGFVASP